MKVRRKVGPKGQVVIPKDLRDHLGLRPGSDLIFEVVGDTVVVRAGMSPEERVREYVNIVKKKLKKEVDLKAMFEEEIVQRVALHR